MKTKSQLDRRIRLAWVRALAKNPELRQRGDDGWEVFRANVYHVGQEDIARLFDVSYRTSQRWHEEFKQPRRVA